MDAIEVTEDGVAGVACERLDTPHVYAAGGQVLYASNAQSMPAPRGCPWLSSKIKNENLSAIVMYLSEFGTAMDMLALCDAVSLCLRRLIFVVSAAVLSGCRR